MSLTGKIQQDMKGAMKERDRTRVSALRMLSSALKNGEIEAGRSPKEGEEENIPPRPLQQSGGGAGAG